LSSCLSIWERWRFVLPRTSCIYVGVLISLWLFLFLFFLFAAQPKEFFLDGLKKLEQQSHKCVQLRGEYVEEMHFFNPVACCFLYKAKDLSAPPRIYTPLLTRGSACMAEEYQGPLRVERTVDLGCPLAQGTCKLASDFIARSGRRCPHVPVMLLCDGNCPTTDVRIAKADLHI
jgi:hypothetical protein